MLSICMNMVEKDRWTEKAIFIILYAKMSIKQPWRQRYPPPRQEIRLLENADSLMTLQPHKYTHVVLFPPREYSIFRHTFIF